MSQACSKHYRPNRLGRVLFMGARGRFAFGRSRPRPSVRKGCLRLAQSGRREAGRMAAPAGKLTTTAPFFIGGILINASDYTNPSHAKKLLRFSGVSSNKRGTIISTLQIP